MSNDSNENQPQKLNPKSKENGPGGGASAPRPALPCLKKHNCTNSGSHWSQFIAEENIRLYIQKVGENNLGVLTLTTPSECLSAFAYQKMWHSWRTRVLKKLFPTGMWIRERQPRTGNWHSHSVVDVGWDIKTGFPFDQVGDRLYANVDPRLRKLWKTIRESAEKYGFGRTELLPLKSNGPFCARYLIKYLTKVRGSDKSEGEEKCRPFGIWGGIRFVMTPFSYTRSRILRKRKAWLAAEMGIECYASFLVVFGSRWWHHLGAALSDVVMPIEYYQVPQENGQLGWDDLGFKAYCADIAKFPSCSVDEAMLHSWHRLFWKVGEWIYQGDEGQIRDFALHKVAQRPRVLLPIDPQLFLKFPQNARGED